MTSYSFYRLLGFGLSIVLCLVNSRAIFPGEERAYTTNDETGIIDKERQEQIGVFANGGQAGRYIQDQAAREKHKVDGKGFSVAILGTTIDDSSTALKGKIIPGISLVSEGSNGIEKEDSWYGTAMASIIAGYSETFTGGIAPGVKIAPVVVFSGNGGDEAAIFMAYERLAQLMPSLETDSNTTMSVVFLPFSSPSDKPEVSALHTKMLTKFLDWRIVVVAPAGNRDERVRVQLPSVNPASSSAVISVGAMSDADFRKATKPIWAFEKPLNDVERGQIAPFSLWMPPNSASPTTIFSPGIGIPVIKDDGAILRISGTGPASAAVAGAVVLIQQKCRRIVQNMFENGGNGSKLGLRAPPERWLPPPMLVREFLVVSDFERSEEYDVEAKTGEGDVVHFRALNVLESLNAVDRKFERDLSAYRAGIGTSVLGFELVTE